MEELRYTYSQLSADTAGRLVALNYDIPRTNSCKFYVLGLHDNYLVESGLEKYILRVYRNDWRSPEDVHFELELLTFLGSRNTLVASPCRTKTGDSSFFIASPEGKRQAALFHYADGYAPGNEISVEESMLLGEAAASVHEAAQGFETDYSRQVLDVPYLLDESVIAIEPFVDVESRDYLHALQNALKSALPTLSREPGIFGICMGDVNPTNFHINARKEITIFDFDQCGYGYRAFEIGKFLSSIHAIEKKHELSKAFIDGYQKIRQLSQEEFVAIPYFEIISVIWVMAIHAYNANRIGYKWLEKRFWDRRLGILKELDSLVCN